MNYSARRKTLLESLPANSISIINSGNQKYSIGDETYPFEVDRNFLYYTGINEPNLVLMFVKNGDQGREILFIEHFDKMMAKWVGGKIEADKAEEISGIKNIRFVEEVKNVIASTLLSFGKVNKYTLLGDLNVQYLGQANPVKDLINEIKNEYPAVEVANLYPYMTDMRIKKDEDEINEMRKAIAITKSGIEAMWMNCRDYIWENEMEAYFDFVLTSEQAGHSFKTICAAGKNATILHYMTNNCQSKAGDLILLDLGASVNKYCADISRTFPINGHFSSRQRQIYDIVLRCNKYIISLAKPGVTTKQLNDKVIEFYEKELGEIGLLENGKTVRDYYWHGVSHHLGLETHDVNLPEYILCPGNVITVEPGLYLEDECIGIRIEDDVLITEDGCEVLSKDILKEADEIENFIQSNNLNCQ